MLSYAGRRRDQYRILRLKKPKQKMVTTGQADTIGGELNLGVVKFKKERTITKEVPSKVRKRLMA